MEMDPSPAATSRTTDPTGASRDARVPWGLAITAAGGSGLAPRSDWSRDVDLGLLAPSADGAGFGVDFPSDLELFAEIGVRSLRWTIDWARLEPQPGRWDPDAVDHVTEVLRAAKRAGVSVWAVLHDGPLPGWFTDDQRGFGDTDGLRRTWPRHVDRVAETFGDLVAAWVPILDPFQRAVDGHLVGARPPHRRDPERFLDALRALHLAGAEAWRLLSSGGIPVACCIDTCPYEPAMRSREPDERLTARSRAEELDRLRFGPWIRALNDGVVSIPGRAEIEIDGLAGGYDIVGLTYRGAHSVFADGSMAQFPIDAVPTPDGRAPWSEGLGVVLRRCADALPHRRFAVLGTGLTAFEDDRRSEVLDASMLELERAHDDRIAIDAAFWESAIDGWTPECGLAVPDGVIDRARHPRPSAAILRAHAARRHP